MAESRWRRRYHRIFIQPKAQIRLFAPFLIFMLTWTAVMFCAAWVFRGMLDQLSGPAQSLTAEDIVHMQALNKKMFQIMMYGSASAIGLSFLFWLSFSHHVFGPMVQIHRQIKKLNDGELDQKIHLRTNDEFHHVAKSLNELTDKLKSRAS